jgi:hypothetical protein
MDNAIWDVTVFTRNRERLLDGDIAEAFFQAVLQQARERSLLSDEHFTVDGRLLEHGPGKWSMGTSTADSLRFAVVLRLLLSYTFFLTRAQLLTANKSN